MYKLVLILIAGILGIATLCISAAQPKMHKTLFVYDYKYKIVETTTQTEPAKNLPTQVNQPEKTEVKTVVKKEVQTTPKSVQKVAQKPVTKTETSVPQAKTVQTTTANAQTPVQTVQTTTTNPLLGMLKETTKSQPEVQKVVEEKIVAPAPVVQKEEVKTPAVQTVTEEEKARQEVILWNKWRSNLQNKIMTDVKLPIIPEGTIFKFSFDVDKYGKISNVQTWSLTPAYTPYAIQCIAPVIRSYQGKDILNFPEGSNRVSTTVEGGWKISKTAKFSTPDDYKDAEKIITKD